jgi:hypothetical protein
VQEDQFHRTIAMKINTDILKRITFATLLRRCRTALPLVDSAKERFSRRLFI